MYNNIQQWNAKINARFASAKWSRTQ
jgi:hypothetical protein